MTTHLLNRVFIINGAESNAIAKGDYNQMMFELAKQFFWDKGVTVDATRVRDGYQVDMEQFKLTSADLVIFQMPIYWFNMPGMLKKYIEEVYGTGVTHGGDAAYGQAGLLTNTHYMLSTTWNAPISAFEAGGTYENLSADDILRSAHVTQEYVGMLPLPSFHAFDILRSPDTETWKKRYFDHLEEICKASFRIISNQRSLA
ncbi:NAD(P)H-dependent oxidoreductase [Fangia hongkongensis]|uniref:NAD(P)H-dependent oxidoreductase n=1 Tax=Fangia hongkongensis TaxID=270495 RepID=UPI00037AF614|nr:NAD(P)H-dependent oxidoreductase [Fangia hongkongensis]MBK2125178.1 NAD(P)H-dependent oxidoreductase [Fangia hongkongensis]